MNERPLSKSQYTRGLQCQKSLWLYRHKPELRTPVSAYDQNILDQGTEFGKLARDLFPGGILIEADHNHPEDALQETIRAVCAHAEKPLVLYEAAVLHDGVIVRVDILVKDVGRGAWDIYEVKSGTGVEGVHLDDVAVQNWVLTGGGYNVDRCHVVHANPKYARKGDLDLAHLFTIVDVTDFSRDLQSVVPVVLTELKRVAEAPAPPEPGIGAHCSKPYDCDFRAQCWAHVPKYSVFNIAYLKMEKKLEFWNKGIERVEQVNPDMHKLTAGQEAQVRTARAGRPTIDVLAITKFLKTLRWPLYFLDFETDNPVIPPYDGLRPYQQMPFQASIHQLDEPGADLLHRDFLANGLEDPRAGLVDFLAHIGPAGSVVAYHKSFEGGRIEELAAWEQRVGVADGLRGIGKRLWDLADPFRTAAYCHPAFEGRWSIKAVLPALVPEMTYKGMAIADGTAAMAAYKRLRDPSLHPEIRAKLLTDLRAYCGQDTLAMVMILRHLFDVTGYAAKAAPAGA